jgi:Ca2+-binding EF-hand superfamily protein
MSIERAPANKWKRTSIIDQTVERLCTPYYIPTNKHWEITFRTLRFSRNTVERFWSIFYRINKAHNGTITILEFLNYFNLERTIFIERCFEYFDCTGDKSIDFLEFMISVFNICTLNVDTLTRFAFDIFDFNDGGELSLPEIETMVQELCGDKLSEGSGGREVLKNINHFAEQRGGVLNLTSFAIYTGNHSLLLLPVFRVQRIIQSKVMGLQYWKNIERNRPDVMTPKHKSVFNARHVQTLLRKYKEGGAAAMLSYCGDPDDVLLQLYTKKEQEENIEMKIDTSKIKHHTFKRAVDRVKKLNSEQKNKLQSVVTSVSLNKLQIAWKERVYQVHS